MSHTLQKLTKCLVTTDEKKTFFVIIESVGKKNYSARLPIRIELKKTVVLNSDVVKLKPDLLLLNTHQDVSPWDLLNPFPPSNYDDYGYICFQDKSGEMTVNWPGHPEEKAVFRFWNILNGIDKQLVENFTSVI